MTNKQYPYGYLFFLLWSIQVFIASILLYLHFEDLNLPFVEGVSSSTFFTYDSLSYRSRAIEFFEGFTNFNIEYVVLFYIKYGVNYASISILGSIIQPFNYYSDLVIFIFNSCLLAIAYRYLFLITGELKCDIRQIFFSLAIFIYIPFSLLQLNKEIIGFVYVSGVLYYLLKKKFTSIILLGALFGIFRVQYLLTSLFAFSSKIRGLILKAILINIIIILFIPPILLDWVYRIESLGMSSSTKNLMFAIEKISYIPIFGVLALVLRIIISLSVGLFSPFIYIKELFTVGSSDFIYHSAIFLLSLFVVKLLVNLYKLKNQKIQFKSEFSVLLNFIIVFCFICSIAPFLQPRYYLPVYFPLVLLSSYLSKKKFILVNKV